MTVSSTKPNAFDGTNWALVKILEIVNGAPANVVVLGTDSYSVTYDEAFDTEPITLEKMLQQIQ